MKQYIIFTTNPIEILGIEKTRQNATIKALEYQRAIVLPKSIFEAKYGKLEAYTNTK